MNQKKLFAVIVCLLAFIFNSSVNGQADNFAGNARGGNSFASDINGRPMYQKTEYIAEGSPYLYEEYCMAEITTVNGKVYQDVKAKINLLERTVLYMDSNAHEMIALTPIKKIRFYSYVQNGAALNEVILQSFDSPINSSAATIYALLQDGIVKLFKKINVTYIDDKRYGESTVTRIFKKDEVFYASLPGKEQLKKIEKNKTAIAALFGPAQAQVLSYIEKQKLKCRTEEDLIEIFRYYNVNLKEMASNLQLFYRSIIKHHTIRQLLYSTYNNPGRKTSATRYC